MSKFTKTKLVLDIRTTPVESSYEGLRGSLMRFWFSVSILIAKKKFDGITIITPMMKEEICNNFGIDSERVEFGHLEFPRLCLIQSIMLQTVRDQREIGAEWEVCNLLSWCFFSHSGLMETVDAMKILAPKYPDIIFFLLGTGSLAPKLEESTQDMVIHKNVIVAKPVGILKFQGLSACAMWVLFHCRIIHTGDFKPLKLLEYLQ